MSQRVHRSQGSQPIDLLPPDAQPCIWMSAGLVAYRLCDRELDCDSCPLDAALRGPQARPAQGADLSAPVEAALRFPDDRHYHAGHAWVLPLGRGRVRCGLDAFAAYLLREARGVVLPAEGSPLVCGQVAWWMADGAELIPLRAPVSGRVLRRNPAVQRHAELVGRAPYAAGWLVEVRCPDAADPAGRLLPAAEARQRATRKLHDLGRRGQRLLQRAHTSAGATLADGGEPLTDLRRMLGPRRYYELVLRSIG